ncbi:MAG: radical SAM protein [Candidatus Nealsonbacteria bacterium]|nr:radical SAM protein [Candidatus Nealsonbacteria bacterium]
MKILFIFPQIGSAGLWSVGIASMSAVLKKAGHKVDLFEIDNLSQQAELLKRIEESRPDVIGISTNSHQFSHAREIARTIKKARQIPIFVGGTHIILFPESLEKEEAFDGVCLGEGEESFLELIDKMQKGEDYFNTKNFWFRRGREIIKNESRKLMEDLDKLPFPDRRIFRYFKKYEQKEIMPRFIFSRGCPFNCTYCCNHALNKKYAGLGKYLRFRSVDKAIEEIADLKKNYNFRHIKLDDDTFSLNKNWLLEFCGKFPKNFNMTFECNIRPGSVDDESLAALKAGGCSMIKVGVESGNELLRKEALGRSISNQDIIELFKKAKNLGLKTYSFNIIGIPGETKKSIEEAVNLNIRLRPGTILGEKCIKEGLIGSGSADTYFKKSILELPTISRKEIELAVQNFKFNIYKHYDVKKAILEKKEQLKNFVISRPRLRFFAKFIYKSAGSLLKT